MNDTGMQCNLPWFDLAGAAIKQEEEKLGRRLTTEERIDLLHDLLPVLRAKAHGDVPS